MRNCIFCEVWSYTYSVEDITEEAFTCVQCFTDYVNEGSSITFCKKCACSTLRLSAADKETSVQLQQASPHRPFYAEEFFIVRMTGHVK